MRTRRVLSALLAGLIALTALAALPGRAAAGPIKVALDRATRTAPLPSGFLGLALEYSTIPQWVGNADTPAQVNPVLLTLVRNLDPTGQPVIRIGGQSTDRSWWPVPKLAPPAGVTYSLTPAWADDARSLAQALDAKLILSVNLEANSLPVSHYEADELYSRIGARYIDAMEIGNEPDLYRTTPWYRVLNGEHELWYKQTGLPVFSRPAGFNENDFIPEFEHTLAVLPPQVPIAGPDAVSASWLGDFSRLVAPKGRIRILDSHSYALLQCVTDPTSPRYPSVPNLLSYGAWHDVLNGALPYIPFTRARGLSFRIDEMGSVSCDGRAGVSNTMASALWATNALFYAAQEGVEGVNLHSYPNSTNGLFDFGAGNAATIHPIYDGALMFARADPVGARLLDFSSNAPSAMQTWATIGADHLVRVLIDNEAGDRKVLVHAPAGFGSRPAAVQRLLAPSAGATSGLTIGGQPFATTSTGAAPTPTPLAISPGRTGYTVNVPADSETLLTLRFQAKRTPTKKPTPTHPKG